MRYPRDWIRQPPSLPDSGNDLAGDQVARASESVLHSQSLDCYPPPGQVRECIVLTMVPWPLLVIRNIGRQASQCSMACEA
jgi:hypothetical protein